MKGADEAEYALGLAQKMGAEYAEAYAESSYSRSFAVEQGRVNSSAYSEETGLRIRLIKDARLFTISTNKLDRRSIRELIARFRAFPGLDTRLSEEPVEKASYRVEEKVSVDTTNMLDDLLKMDKELGAIKYVKYRSLYGGLGRSATYYINSEGSSVRSNIPSTASYFAIVLSNGRESRETRVQLGNTGGYENFDARKISDKLSEQCKSLYRVMEKGRVLSESELLGIKNVMISPEISGIAAHESIGHPTEADRIFGREAAQAGTSYITRNNIGLQVGSESVNIVDDPTMKNKNGFYLYDDEGVRARPRFIIEKGVQKELLMNREYARVLGKKSNGASRSDSYSNEPLVRMANTYLKPGTSTFDELVSEAKNGVYLKGFDNTEWNIDDTRSFGRYAGNETYMIRNGRIEEPVKNYKIEAYTLDFWHAVRLVGNDFETYAATCGKGEPMQGVPVSMGGASALLKFR